KPRFRTTFKRNCFRLFVPVACLFVTFERESRSESPGRGGLAQARAHHGWCRCRRIPLRGRSGPCRFSRAGARCAHGTGPRAVTTPRATSDRGRASLSARRAHASFSVVTGGAGFIGSNLAHALLERGDEVLLLDNLSRPGVEHNVRWLIDTHGDRVK